jgi:hypothetical protein
MYIIVSRVKGTTPFVPLAGYYPDETHYLINSKVFRYSQDARQYLEKEIFPRWPLSIYDYRLLDCELGIKYDYVIPSSMGDWVKV